LARSPVLEKRLGYRFRNAALLDQALTHRSHGSPNNERLEFLGDGVLGCVMAEELCRRFPGFSEGELTRLRADLVRQESLHEVADTLALQKYLRLGDSERAGGADVRPSILADALEALFGAVFLDGGYDAARKAILGAYAEALAKLDPQQLTKDAKTQLQELMQGKHRKLPEYRVVAVHGAAHRQSFDVECVVSGLGLSATGSGTSRQRAEQQAAENVLQKLPK
jgi:ribonuclease III